MSAVGNYYSGPYYFNNTQDLYIHIHSENIGRAGGNASSISQDSLVNYYKMKKKMALEASKNQYKTLFLQSLNLDSKILLNELLNTDKDIMTQISNQMKIKLQDILSVDKMTKLMALERSVTTFDFAKTLLEGNEESLNNFNILLQSLNEAYDLLKKVGKNGKAFSSILAVTSTQSMGKYLLDAIQNFERNNQRVGISQIQIDRANNIIQQINALGRSLKRMKTGEGNDLTPKAVKKLIENIFNTGFAESISSFIKSSAFKVLKEKGLDTALTGSKQVSIQYSDQFGRLTTTGDISSSGKADVKFNNMHFEVTINGEKKDIIIDLGISDKFYTSNFFPGLDRNSSNLKSIYSSGSGGNLAQALSALFGSNVRLLYLAYNTFAHGEQNMKIAQEALQDILLTRQVVRLFSSRGGAADFAQYIFANGQIISIWDIILKSINDISLSKSVGGIQIGQPITLTIENRAGIYNATKNIKVGQAIRIKNINDAIKKAIIKAELNLKNI